jgi:predicted dithiol-disulfide oxidoreductase (DUF899 family)
VFTRDADGALRHFYSAHSRMAEEIGQRGIDLMTPVYNFLDLTPPGRVDWHASLDYGTKVPRFRQLRGFRAAHGDWPLRFSRWPAHPRPRHFVGQAGARSRPY